MFRYNKSKIPNNKSLVFVFVFFVSIILTLITHQYFVFLSTHSKNNKTSENYYGDWGPDYSLTPAPPRFPRSDSNLKRNGAGAGTGDGKSDSDQPHCHPYLRNPSSKHNPSSNYGSENYAPQTTHALDLKEKNHQFSSNKPHYLTV